MVQQKFLETFTKMMKFWQGSIRPAIPTFVLFLISRIFRECFYETHHKIWNTHNTLIMSLKFCISLMPQKNKLWNPLTFRKNAAPGTKWCETRNVKHRKNGAAFKKKLRGILEHWKTQVLTYAIFYPGCWSSYMGPQSGPMPSTPGSIGERRWFRSNGRLR